jgi:SAM-dependent methyltransferase
VYLEAAAAAAAKVLDRTDLVIADLRLHEALVLQDGLARTVQTTVTTSEPLTASVQIFSQDPDDNGGAWTLHASASAMARASTPPSAGTEHTAAIQARCDEVIDGSAFYARVNAEGIDVGGSVRAIERVWRREGEVLAQLSIPPEIAGDHTFRLHPAVLDAAILTVGAAVSPPAGQNGDTVPALACIDRTVLVTSAAARIFSHVVVREQTAAGLVADLRLFDERGGDIASLEGIRIARAPKAALRRGLKPLTDPLLYDVKWRRVGTLAAAMPAGEFMPRPSALARDFHTRFEVLGTEHRLEEMDAVLPDLDRACGEYVVNAFTELGFGFRVGESGTVADLAERLRVAPRHRRLLSRLLLMLQQDGVLAFDGERWKVITVPQRGDPDGRCQELGRRHPAFIGQPRATAACGSRLGGVLKGEVDPLQLLFPNGSFELTEALYQHSPFAKAYNALMAELAAHVAAAVPEGRTLRCLEVGAGTGGTSAYVLPVLPADRTEYWYTDLSKLFLERAREKFGAHPFLRFGLFDVERDGVAQGFTAGSFDLILASNVVHATADLRVTLGNIKRLLAPGGLLILLEGTEEQRSVDLTFGLLEGWWRFVDRDVRPSYPLLSQRGWRTLLDGEGFSDVAVLPQEDARQAVIVAQRSREVSGASQDRAGRRQWVIVSDRNELASRLATVLAASSARVERVASPASDPDALAATLTALTGDVEVVCLEGHRDEAIADTGFDQLVSSLSSVAGTVRALTEAPREGRVRVWLATTGAQAPTAAGAEVRPLQAPLWGLGRVIALEHPEIWGGLIDLDPSLDVDACLSQLPLVVETAGSEDQVAVRDGVRYVPRLARASAEPRAPLVLRAEAGYLVTGGTGGLAVPLVRWMAEHGARHLVLASRSGLPATAATDGRESPIAGVVRELETKGVRVEVVACDVTDRDALGSVIRSFGAARPPLAGVMHAAAAMSGSAVRDLDPALLGSMLAAKVAGTRLLDQLTRGLDLDFFVTFSSTTALWGVAGLGHYAAANEFLDAWVWERAAAGLPALSVNWGTWDEMRLASEQDRRSFVQAGLLPLSSADALDRLGWLLAAGSRRKVVADVDWPTFKAVYQARRLRPFLSEVEAEGDGQVSRHADRDSVSRNRGEAGIVGRLRVAPAHERQEGLLTYLREQVAAVLELPSTDIPMNRGLLELGMDSLMSVELKKRLELGLEHPLPPTLTFKYPDIASMAAFIERDILDGAADHGGPGEPALAALEEGEI